MAASARHGERATSFALACSLLSRFVRQNGATAAELGLGIKGEAAPVTMSLLPGSEGKEAERKKETMELFPQSAGFGTKDSPSESARKQENKEKQQLTIFYGGKVLVFDGFPADKTKDPMQLATKGSPVVQNLGLPQPSAPATDNTKAKKLLPVPVSTLPVMQADAQKPARPKFPAGLNNVDHQEPRQSTTRSAYRSHYLPPLIALAVRTSNWDFVTKISFRECVMLYGLSQSTWLFALLVQSFSPRRIREIRCLIQSMIDYCRNAGPDLFELAPMLASNLGGSMTLLQVYATIIRIFTDSSMFEDALLTYVEANKVGVDVRLCNFLLKSLVDGNQIIYARSLFDDMKNCGPPPNVYSYSVLMSMYTHGERLCLEEASEILCEMQANDVRPNAATYGTYLYGLCRARKVTSAWEFLQMIFQRGYPCNNYCFNTVIHGFCNEGEVYKALEVFFGMKNGGFVPDVHSYSILVNGLCKQGEGGLSKGCDVIDDMQRNGIDPNLVSYTSLLHGLCKTGNVKLAFELFESLKKQGFKHDQIIYSVIFHGCCQHLDLEMVYGLWNDMIQCDFAPDVYNYTSLIYALCRHKHLKDALGVFELMLENGTKPNIVTCTILVDSFCKEGLIGEAFLFLDKAHQLGIAPNICTYKVIINGLCKIHKCGDIWEFFANMIKRGYVPDIVLYSIIIDGFVKALKLQEAFKLYHKMLDEGIEPNVCTYTSLVNGLCHDDRLPEAMNLLKGMVGKELVPDIILYTSVIACYCRRSNMQAAVEVFEEMKRIGLSPDAFVYTCLISGYSKVRAMDGARLMMEEMKKRDITPTVVTYTALIIGYFKIGDEKEANMLYKKMLQEGITPDAMLSCILDLSNDEGDSKHCP